MTNSNSKSEMKRHKLYPRVSGQGRVTSIQKEFQCPDPRVYLSVLYRPSQSFIQQVLTDLLCAWDHTAVGPVMTPDCEEDRQL